MSMPYIGEIRMFGGNFAPNGWMFCNGAILPISEYDTLFNLIGTTYGGDGQETFALPNLCSRVPLHAGGSAGSGLSNRVLGEQGGVETVTLTQNQIPVHSHAPYASNDAATNDYTAANGVPGNTGGTSVYGLMGTPGPMTANAIGPAGSSAAHDNMGPYLCVNFIISLFGIYPSPT